MFPVSFYLNYKNRNIKYSVLAVYVPIFMYVTDHFTLLKRVINQESNKTQATDKTNT